jgi:uncharacterized protein
MLDIISSKKMYFAYLSGAKEVILNKNMLNKINVFPVADGDTGTNLFSTMNSIIQDSDHNESIKTTMNSIADSALKGARGNSGIIFAQYLYGLSMETEDTKDSLTINNFISSNLKAVNYAYKAISEPVEGTIITVIKDWANSLNKLEQQTNDFLELISNAYKELEKSVNNTPNQLKILKLNSVVDSGAKGFALFIKGFLEHLRSNNEELDLSELQNLKEDLVINEMPHNRLEIKHRYCTEAVVESNKINPDEIRNDLSELGDSLLIANNTQKAKIHLHTDKPFKMFEILKTKGKITYQKVDDMIKQNDIMENRKYDIAIVTDTIADLPMSYIDEHQIHVLPLNVHLGDTNYLDRLTLRTSTILDYIDDLNNVYPTSSQPDYKTIENLFSFLSSYYKSIIVVTISNQLSGTYSIVSKVAEDFKEKFPNIYVIDSKMVSCGEGLILQRCVNYVKNGMNINEILEKIEKDVKNTKLLMNLKSIDTIIRSGRLSASEGKIAKLVNLTPIVSMDKNGKTFLLTISFSHKNAIKKAYNIIKKLMKKKNIENYGIVHVGNPDLAEIYATEFTRIIGKKPEFIEEVSPVTSISGGRGTVAISYITD